MTELLLCVLAMSVLLNCLLIAFKIEDARARRQSYGRDCEFDLLDQGWRDY